MSQSRRSMLETMLAAVGGAALPVSLATAQASTYFQFLNVTDFGAVGDGKADDTAAFQTAVDLGAQEGRIVAVPKGRFRLRSIAMRRNTFLLLSPVAELLATRQRQDNQLFALRNPVNVAVRLIEAKAGLQSISVEDTSSLLPGDRVIVSGGTFKGSGVEEGPIEFNTVERVVSASVVQLATPLQYSYTTLGLPDTRPRVQSLGPEAATLRNVRISGGTLRPFTDFNSIYFNFANVEDVEIDHVTMDGLGGGVATGHNVSNLRFHDNRVRGRGLAEGHGFDIASVVQSNVSDNLFNVQNDGENGGHYNHLVFEVACRDNIVERNDIGPVRNALTAGIDFTFYSFGNRILHNRLWGCAGDLQAGAVTLGIRTLANGIVASHPGNQILGNRISDLAQAIADGHSSSVILGNSVRNETAAATSVGINCGDGLRDVVENSNSFVNVAQPIRSNTGAAAGFAILGGAAPPGDFAGAGALYLQRDARPGEHLWRRERVGRSLQWLPVSALTPVAFANLTAAVDGTMLYVLDGIPSTNPLRSGGRGCVAVRESGVWRGI